MPWTRIQILLLLALVAVEVADLVTFFPAISVQGLEGEQNPLARNVYAAIGPLGMVCLKAASTSAILGLLYVSLLPRVRGWNVVVMVMICLVAIGPLSNVIAATDGSSRSGNQGEKGISKIGEAGPFIGSSLSRCDALDILGDGTRFCRKDCGFTFSSMGEEALSCNEIPQWSNPLRLPISDAGFPSKSGKS